MASSGLRPLTCDLRLSTRRKGFTLIELVVAVAIMGIMALVTVDYIASAGLLYMRLLAQHQADGELLDAVDRLRWEARTAQSTLTATSNEWTFNNAQGVRTNRLAGREATLNGNILLRGVDRFAFTYYDATNGSTTNPAAVRCVELWCALTNGPASSEMIVCFFMKEGFLK